MSLKYFNILRRFNTQQNQNCGYYRMFATQTSSTFGFESSIPSFEEDRYEILNTQLISSAAKLAQERYYELRKAALEGGGAKGIERHVQKNKKVLIRDRIKSLIDPGSEFVEFGDLAGFDMLYGDVPAAGLVTGIGKIQGVYCMVSGNDATVKAGTYYPITVVKAQRCQELAEILRTPTVYMPDSGGAFLPLQSEIFPDKKHGGRGFYNQAIMSSKGIHQIALVNGSCTAGAAYNPTMSDEAIIVDKIGKIFLAGPPLVKMATGESITDEDLGGGFLHSSISGCTDYFARDEKESFMMCRDIIYSLNMNTIPEHCTFKEPLPALPWKDVAEGREFFSKVDLYVILSGILDGSKFHEFKAYYGQGAITGTGCIKGQRVGIVANMNDIGSKEALKITHFINSCNRRGMAVLFLQNFSFDNDSNNDVEESESYDQHFHLIKCRGALASMIATLSVPKIAITLSGLSQNGFLTMCGPGFKPTFHFVWPQAKISAFDMTKLSENSTFDAFYAAANMIVDAIIPPAETRQVISQVLQVVEQRKLNPEPQVESNVLRM